jgi:thiamine biosynthesis lipoprotein
MACRFEITLPGDAGTQVAAARKALDDVDRLENCLSVFRSESEISRLNRRGGEGAVPVSADLLAILRRSVALHEATDGAFDVTSTPLSRCWGFLRREGRLPSGAEIDSARARLGMRRLELDEAARTVSIQDPRPELNVNAIGKGYAIDAAAAVLRRNGVERALLSAGGSSLRAMGGGAGFVVDVRSPRRNEGPLARLRLRHAALGTSGA